jgi:hypothetical protein
MNRRLENYRPIVRNSLQGTFDVKIDDLLVIKGWCHHKKDGEQWKMAALPMRR